MNGADKCEWLEKQDWKSFRLQSCTIMTTTGKLPDNWLITYWQILDDCLKNAKQILVNWLRNAREIKKVSEHLPLWLDYFKSHKTR